LVTKNGYRHFIFIGITFLVLVAEYNCSILAQMVINRRIIDKKLDNRVLPVPDEKAARIVWKTAEK